MNSTMEVLAAAVPMVAIPHTPEEQTTAERVATLGLGSTLAPIDATAERLREAVRGLLDEPSARQRLRAMQNDLRAAGGAVHAADAIEPTCPGEAGSGPCRSAPRRSGRAARRAGIS